MLKMNLDKAATDMLTQDKPPLRSVMLSVTFVDLTPKLTPTVRKSVSTTLLMPSTDSASSPMLSPLPQLPP